MEEKKNEKYLLDKQLDNERRLNSLETDLKAFLKNVNITKLFIAIILAVLAFFGFREINQIRNSVMQSIQPQIRYVDSLTKSIQTAKLDSLTLLIKKRGEEEKLVIKKLDDLITSSKEVENRFIQIMPSNEIGTSDMKYPHTVSGSTHYFEIKSPENHLSSGNEKRSIVLKLFIPSDSVQYIFMIIYERENNIKTTYCYLPKDGYNKLEFINDLKQPNYIDVGLFLKKDWNLKNPSFYRTSLLVKNQQKRVGY